MYKKYSPMVFLALFCCFSFQNIDTCAQNKKKEIQVPLFINNSEFNITIQREILPPATTMVFTQNNRFLITGSYGEILIWDLANANLSNRINLNEKMGNVRCMAFTDKQNLLIGGGQPAQNGYIELVNLSYGESIWKLELNNDAITSIAVNKSKKRAILGSATGNLSVIDISSGKVSKTLPKLSDEISSISIADGDSLIRMSSLSGELKVWNLNQNKVWMDIQENQSITGVQFLQNRQLIYSTNSDKDEGELKRIPVADNTIKKIKKNLNPNQNNIVTSLHTGFTQLVMNNKKNITILPCGNGEIQLYKTWAKGELQRINAHTSVATSVAIASNQKFLASADIEGTIILMGLNGSRILTFSQLKPKSDAFFMITRNGFYTGLETSDIKLPPSQNKINFEARNNQQKLITNINAYLKK